MTRKLRQNNKSAWFCFRSNFLGFKRSIVSIDLHSVKKTKTDKDEWRASLLFCCWTWSFLFSANKESFIRRVSRKQIVSAITDGRCGSTQTIQRPTKATSSWRVTFRVCFRTSFVKRRSPSRFVDWNRTHRLVCIRLSFQAQTSFDQNPTGTGDVFRLTLNEGMMCLNQQVQGFKSKLCSDYKVRFCCPNL